MGQDDREATLTLLYRADKQISTILKGVKRTTYSGCVLLEVVVLKNTIRDGTVLKYKTTSKRPAFKILVKSIISKMFCYYILLILDWYS